MKRDMDFVRELLLYIEKATPARNGWINVSIPDRPQTEIAYHLQLMTEAGLIQTQHVRTRGSDDWYPTTITWSGHDFLDAARNDSIWNKAKLKLMEAGTGATLSILKELLVRLTKEALG
jgi:hypothetical protein